MPNTEVKIVEVGSGGDAELPVGKEGELWIRGPQIMKGYLNRPEETAGCLDRDGWYHTGDVGRLDEDGDLWILGRVDDMIISGGENIHPLEVEDVLASHPQVVEVAVVAATDEIGRASCRERVS